ncbi:MAG: hypothetical protein GC131_06275 [Alphaproteobacteria bacterium]|nr:hypothetical protein [Alphaproteobacteria bacterium]
MENNASQPAGQTSLSLLAGASAAALRPEGFAPHGGFADLLAATEVKADARPVRAQDNDRDDGRDAAKAQDQRDDFNAAGRKVTDQDRPEKADRDRTAPQAKNRREGIDNHGQQRRAEVHERNEARKAAHAQAREDAHCAVKEDDKVVTDEAEEPVDITEGEEPIALEVELALLPEEGEKTEETTGENLTASEQPEEAAKPLHEQALALISGLFHREHHAGKEENAEATVVTEQEGEGEAAPALEEKTADASEQTDAAKTDEGNKGKNAQGEGEQIDAGAWDEIAGTQDAGAKKETAKTDRARPAPSPHIEAAVKQDAAQTTTQAAVKLADAAAQIEALRNGIRQQAQEHLQATRSADPAAAKIDPAGNLAAAGQKTGPYNMASELSHLRATRGGTSGLPAPVEQIAMRLHLGAKQGADRMTIQLRPAELGQVDVKLHFKDGAVRGTVVADNQAAMDLLQKDVRSLERALQEAGLRADPGCLEFSLRDHSGRQAQQSDKNAGGNAGNAGAGQGAVPADEMDGAEVQYITPGRVNIRV